MRNHWKKLLVVVCVVFAGITATLDSQPEYCFPENDLYISADAKSSTAMDEATFNYVIDVVEDIYKPVVKKEGGELQVIRKWEDGTVNAYAQRVGKVYKVSMFGGLARHATVTPEGFALVVCHEVGHHIGGAPKKRSFFGVSWASNEGQADYWGVNKCMKKVLDVLNVDSELEEEKDYQYALKACEGNYDNQEEQLLCARSSMAGKSLAELFRALRSQAKEIHFWTKDKGKVKTTNHNHPAPQCRMDTYFSGSLCDKDADAGISNTDEAKGFCYEAGKHTALERPLCWFKPKK